MRAFPTSVLAVSPRLVRLALLGSVVLLTACGDDESAGGGGAGGATTASTSTGGPAGSTSTSNGPTGSASSGGGAASSGTGQGSSSSTTGGAASFSEMCASPGVIFCDAFEQVWDPSWIEDGGDVAIVEGAAVPGEGATVVELSTYESTQSSKLLRTFDGVEAVYIRFDVQYADDYDNSGGSHGLILGGSDAPPWGMLGTAGLRPDGSDFFVLNFEPDGIVGQGGELGFYAYFMNMEMSGDGNYWGNVFTSSVEPPPVIVPGAWHCAEYGLTLNTPGAQDGTASFWVDGVHHGTFEGFEWRSDPSLQVSTFALDSYNHMNDGPIPAATPNRVRYDNLVVSTSPVGCL